MSPSRVKPLPSAAARLAVLISTGGRPLRHRPCLLSPPSLRPSEEGGGERHVSAEVRGGGGQGRHILFVSTRPLWAGAAAGHALASLVSSLTRASVSFGGGGWALRGGEHGRKGRPLRDLNACAALSPSKAWWRAGLPLPARCLFFFATCSSHGSLCAARRHPRACGFLGGPSGSLSSENHGRTYVAPISPPTVSEGGVPALV